MTTENSDGAVGANPNLKPFPKGKSGNPAGRPKALKEVQELARTHTREAIEKLAEWMRSDNAKASVAACNAILDRAWGKASQPVDFNPNVEGFAAIWAVISQGRSQ